LTADALVSRSPQWPDDVLIEDAATAPTDVAAVADRARAAGRAWATSAAARATALRAAGDLLLASAGELEELIVREVGKPRLEARGEVGRSISILHYYAQQALDPVGETYPPSLPGLLYTERRPLGVAGLITPWNFPLAIPLWKAAPALAAGNAVILKPSTEALACARRLESLLSEVLPEGLFTVMPGEGETGQALVKAVDVLSFTGSSAVGLQVAVAATRQGIPVQAEMGGQNAAIVLPEADIEGTAAMLAAASMGYAGQKCTATRRVLVVGDPTAFTEAYVAAVAALTPADPGDESTTVGPLISGSARDKVVAAAGEARSAGGQVLTGGTAPDREGWFAAPTVVSGLTPDARLACDETFGPFVAVLAVSDLETAVKVCNSVPYGLVSSVHSQDLEAALRAVVGLDTGLIKVNAPTTGVDFYAPFGGEKASSSGPREQGKAGMDFYSSLRTITIAPGTRRTA